jgi:nuclear transport factor 2 (NTF2) superfamily protein
MTEPARSADVVPLHDAERLAKYHQGLTGSGKPDRIIEAFAPDVVVRFADFPEMHGLEELKRFLVARFEMQKNYQLKKQPRAISQNVLVCSWDATWEDGRDGRLMEGHGVELMTIRDDKITLWEAVFNVWEQGKRGSLPIV